MMLGIKIIIMSFLPTSLPELLLFLIALVFFNLCVYGLSNRNIASNGGKNIKNAFWLGILGPVGTIICLVQSVDPTMKKVLYGVGRLLFWSIGTQIDIEIGLVTDVIAPVLTYLFGVPFILRGMNVFNFSTKAEQ